MDWRRGQVGSTEFVGADDEIVIHKPGGITAWLSERLFAQKRASRRLALLERISLAPHQSLALVQAEGRRFLVAISAEGTPAFYPLESGACAVEDLPCALADVTEREPAQWARASW